MWIGHTLNEREGDIARDGKTWREIDVEGWWKPHDLVEMKGGGTFKTIYLGINSNDLVALLTAIGEYGLVAFDTIRMVITQDIALSCQGFVTLPAAEMS